MPRVESRVVASHPVAAGDRVFVLEGEPVAQPTRHSLQIDHDLHLDVAAPARYMNHACDPSVAIRGREVVALRDLAPGDEITFDYNTTEYEMAAPFTCRCSHCDGRVIGGFSRLDPEERERLRPLLAPHLLRA